MSQDKALTTRAEDFSAWYNDVIARAEDVGTEIASRVESLRFLAPWRRPGDPANN